MKPTNQPTNQRIALVHDYLNEAGGAERVLRVLADMYPEAPIYTAFAKNGTAKKMFSDRKIIESAWAPLLKIGRLYSFLRFLLPWIWGSIDLSGYDLIITSTSGGYIARGFKVKTSAKVIAYCHTPPKWLYGYETPTGAMGKWWGKVFMWVFGPFLRYFDFQSAQRVDVWIANSKEVAKRIEKFYRKPSVVVYPPIGVDLSTTLGMTNIRSDYYLLVTRVTGAKGVMEAVKAAICHGFKLKLVGEIVEARMKKTLAGLGKNVEVLGRVDEQHLADLYSRAKGFIALARDEDFGMTVVESMMYGTPVLAYNGGGYKETVVSGKNGILIDGVDIKSVGEGIKQMEKIKWNKDEIKKSVAKFGRERFEKEISQLVNKLTN